MIERASLPASQNIFPYLRRAGLLLILMLTTACQPATVSTQPTQVPTPDSPTPVATPQVVPSVQPMPPLWWDVITDDFEGGSFDPWGRVSESDLSLAPGMGLDSSTALSVRVHKRETYLYKTELLATTEGYLSFWFNPNHVEIPLKTGAAISGESIRIADIKGSGYDVVIALRVWNPSAQGYRAYLEWQAEDGRHFDLEKGQFALKDGWQRITLGFRIDDWVAVWVDDVLMREVSGVHHTESHGSIVELGKANDDNSSVPVGVLYYDEVAFQRPRIAELWVDALHGSDSNSGLAREDALLTLQAAANLAGPGTTVHVLSGVYRESLDPAADGEPTEPVVYLAEPGAVLRGSEPSRNVVWTRLETNSIGLPADVDVQNIYYADLSNWGLDEAPRFVVQLDDMGSVSVRLSLAREPDWQVKAEWKVQEFWWQADGGGVRAGCDPTTEWDCDIASRSFTQLLDASDDLDPQGVEAGNLTSLGELTGATLIAMDAKQGHYSYRRLIVSHDVEAGLITVNRACEYDEGSGQAGLGWGTKYYVEGKPALLDSPGEWWYDSSSGLLYFWSPEGTNPAELNLEISRLQHGIDLSQRSNIVVDGLVVEMFNGDAVHGYNEAGERSFNNRVRNALLRYANHGVRLQQVVSGDAEAITRGFSIEDTEIAYMDSKALDLTYTWANESAPDAFTVAGITDTLIADNELHHLGFRADGDNAVGVSFRHADHLRFEGNHVHHVAHNGVQFSWSVIHSEKAYGFDPGEIRTSEILVNGNLFERTCQLTADCGTLKFWGDPPDGHVYRDVLVTGNIFRDTFGWTSVAAKRGLWNDGMGGFGLYLDMVSGIHVYRNIAYNNAFAGFYFGGVWRDGDVLLYNNIAANSLYGLFFSGFGADGNPTPNTQVMNNILLNNESYGFWFTDSHASLDGVAVDFNLYADNGWRADGKGGAMIIRRGQDDYDSYPSLADIQAGTSWETHGHEGGVDFLRYDLNDHDLFDNSIPDFHIKTFSENVVDKGTADLPASLTALLELYGLVANRQGSAFDIGRYELGDPQIP